MTDVSPVVAFFLGLGVLPAVFFAVLLLDSLGDALHLSSSGKEKLLAWGGLMFSLGLVCVAMPWLATFAAWLVHGQ